jgi:DNA-binding LacI/PurR family transcriptional regulator
MQDIADIAGVSRATVSRALADSPRVSSKTKDRIKELAKEHNYQMNVAARNFRLKRSLNVAVLLPATKYTEWKISHPFVLDMIAAIAEAADKKGIQLIIARSSAQDANWIKRFVESRQADGLILIGQGEHHKVINELAGKTSAISVWGEPISTDQTYPVVGSDNELGGFRATEHLIEQGCKRILFLGKQDHPELNRRYEGYRRALEKYKIDYAPELTLETKGTVSDIKCLLQNLLESNTLFDGIFAVGDVLAIAAMNFLQTKNVKIPLQVKVVGYDNVPLSEFMSPSLTTINQSRAEGGERLIENLLDIMNGKPPSFSYLEPKLIVRASSRSLV